MHERARAENMIQEIRQLVKDQSTDMARLRQLGSDLQQLAAGLAASGAGQDGRQQGGAADEVIDAEFKPRS
jgi:molecular chaperone DnaK